MAGPDPGRQWALLWAVASCLSFPIQCKGWEALCPVGRKEGGSWGHPLASSPRSAPMQVEALHLLQVPCEGDERHWGQRIQRGVGVAHHLAGGSARAAAPGAEPGGVPQPGHPPVPRASPQPHCPLLPTAPEEAPTILSVTPHTTTSVLIRWQVLSLVPSTLLGIVGLSPLGGGTEAHWGQSPWGAGDQSSRSLFPPEQPPAEDKINGILLGFRLRYRELVYDSLRGVTLRGIGHPGATWAELTRECWWPC